MGLHAQILSAVPINLGSVKDPKYLCKTGEMGKVRFYGHSYLSFALPSLFTTKAACSERGLNCETSCRCSMPDVVLCIEYSTNMPKSKIIIIIIIFTPVRILSHNSK